MSSERSHNLIKIRTINLYAGGKKRKENLGPLVVQRGDHKKMVLVQQPGFMCPTESA